jgi:hypothetical protein
MEGEKEKVYEHNEFLKKEKKNLVLSWVSPNVISFDLEFSILTRHILVITSHLFFTLCHIILFSWFTLFFFGMKLFLFKFHI